MNVNILSLKKEWFFGGRIMNVRYLTECKRCESILWKEMKQVCCKNSKNYCHPTTHNHIHSTEKSGLKNKTCISLWPFGSGICLTIQAKCLIAPHLPLSYFPPHLFVFHHSLLHCPLANCRLFKLNLYQVILRFAALFTRWFAMSWQKFQVLYCFKVAETF